MLNRTRFLFVYSNIISLKRTIFTGADRYNYIDPDYAYTNQEMEAIENHKLVYKTYIDNLRFYREEKFRNR